MKKKIVFKINDGVKNIFCFYSFIVTHGIFFLVKVQKRKTSKGNLKKKRPSYKMVHQIASSSLGGVRHSHNGELGSLACGGRKSRANNFSSGCERLPKPTPASCGANCDGWKKKKGLRFRFKQVADAVGVGATATAAGVTNASSTVASTVSSLMKVMTDLLRKLMNAITSVDYRGGYNSAVNWASSQSQTVISILASVVGIIVLLLTYMFL